MRAVVALRSVLLPLLLVADARAADAVSVDKQPPTCVVRTFDPKNPPKEMPALKGEEAALTVSDFLCQVQVEVETTSGDSQPAATKITGVHASIRLDMTEWLPRGASAKLKAHEEGHRKLSEHFYESAQVTAGELARKYIGQSVDVKPDDAEASAAAIKKIAATYCQEYLGAIEQPSEKVQAKYDQITDHGRNKVAEDTAIRKALGQ